MKNIFKLLIVSLIFTACEDSDTVIYDGSPNNPTFLSFQSSAIDFPIIRTEGSDLVLTLNSSTVSNVDRVYDIVIDEEASTADDALYNMPSQITIPAGSYQGSIIVEGFDNDIDNVIKTVVFSLNDIYGATMDNLVTTLQLYEVCPLYDDFTGDYAVTQIGNGAPINPGDLEIFGEDDTVPPPVITLEEGSTPFERVFTAKVYPELSGGGIERTFKFRLTCDGINLVSVVDLNAGCGDNTLKFGPGNVNGTYDDHDDSVILLRLTEDVTGSCQDARQVTLQLNKVVD